MGQPVFTCNNQLSIALIFEFTLSGSVRTSRPRGFQLAQEMLPILRALLSRLVDGKRAVRLLGVITSGLNSFDEMR